MTAEVAELFEKAMLLPQEAREELAGAILERSGPSEQYMGELLEVVERRIENVRTGKSSLIPADQVLRDMREMLAAMK